ncbi:MAG: hypothetical protein J6O71_03900 [Lachnospiraceae bacterium]|nr:hypothetical protein [Lachnospiraceae bacterium]
MRYIEDLYYGERASKNKLFSFWRLKHGKAPADTYVLTLPWYEDGILEIRKLSRLKHKIYERHPLTVVGVAYGYEEAVLLAADIVKEIYEKSGSFDIKGFLKER